jgi:Na+-transporting NADH:ubiquinone oxidoreductase subunit NqrB
LKWPAALTLPKIDPRYYQIVFLGTFLLTGILFLGWTANLWAYATLIVSTQLSQLTLARLTTRDYSGWKSAAITSLGLSLLLKANGLETYFLAGVLAIASKFAFTVQRKHFFNPANFGIVAVVLLTGDAWVSPGQWGHGAELCFLIVALGALVTGKVGRWDTSVAFLGTFALLLLGYDVLYKGWEVDVWSHKLMNGSLLLFTFFMITDPRAIPDNRRVRIGWAMSVAVLALVITTQRITLGTQPMLHTSIIWSLFFLSPVVPILDRFYPAQRFQWKPA